MRIAIVGGGTIGQSLAQTLVQQKKNLPEHLLVIERNEHTCDEIRRSLGCYTSTAYHAPLSEVDCVVLAVKPQDFRETAVKLKDFLKPHQILLSMMTGVRCETLSNELSNHQKIARCMPNLPLVVGKGMSICYAAHEFDDAERLILTTVLSVCGELLFVPNEDLVDAATALSASGPGILAYLAEHFERAARELGYTPEDSRRIVSQTMAGTAELMIQKGWSPKEIQTRVASKGGTTEAGITELEEQQVGGALQAAFARANARARELGK